MLLWNAGRLLGHRGFRTETWAYHVAWRWEALWADWTGGWNVYRSCRILGIAAVPSLTVEVVTPECYSLVHLDTFGADIVAEELYSGAMDLRHMVAMFDQVPGVYKDVVDVDDHELMEELPEYLVHEALVDGRWVGKAIRHDLIFIVARWCDECRLPLIARPDTNDVISDPQVQLGENAGPTEFRGRLGLWEVDTAASLSVSSGLGNQCGGWCSWLD